MSKDLLERIEQEHFLGAMLPGLVCASAHQLGFGAEIKKPNSLDYVEAKFTSESGNYTWDVLFPMNMLEIEKTVVENLEQISERILAGEASVRSELLEELQSKQSG